MHRRGTPWRKKRKRKRIPYERNKDGVGENPPVAEREKRNIHTTLTRHTTRFPPRAVRPSRVDAIRGDHVLTTTTIPPIEGWPRRHRSSSSSAHRTMEKGGGTIFLPRKTRRSIASYNISRLGWRTGRNGTGRDGTIDDAPIPSQQVPP